MQLSNACLKIHIQGTSKRQCLTNTQKDQTDSNPPKVPGNSQVPGGAWGQEKSRQIIYPRSNTSHSNVSGTEIKKLPTSSAISVTQDGIQYFFQLLSLSFSGQPVFPKQRKMSLREVTLPSWTVTKQLSQDLKPVSRAPRHMHTGPHIPPTKAGPQWDPQWILVE